MYACCRYNLFTYLVTLHTENLNERFSFQGVQLSQLHQHSRLHQLGCTCRLVGAVLALASGKAERRQLHPLERTAPPVKSK